jgi:malonyl-CoA O-methyltransferase
LTEARKDGLNFLNQEGAWRAVNIDKSRLKRLAGRSAATYDEHAVVQKKMAHRLLQNLQERNIGATRILELGCGTGYATQLLLDHFPEAKVVAVDFSEEMIAVAREKVEPASRVRFVVGDAEAEDFGSWGPFDLVVSNALLHWLEDPAQAIRRWNRHLVPGGWLASGTYGPDTFMELRFLFQRVEEELGVEPQPHVLSLRSPGEWEKLLGEAGMVQVGTLESWHRVEFPDCRSFLQAVKAVGENLIDNRHPLPVQRKVLREVMLRYDRSFRQRGGIYATCHLTKVFGKKLETTEFSFSSTSP